MAFIQLNKQNFFHNLTLISQKAGGKEKVALVLKDNAYGHGLMEMAHLAKEFGIKKAVVQLESEARAIEPFFDYILVLADIPKQPSDMIRYTINTLENIENFPKNTKVELKVDTGMHRNGIDERELEEAFWRIVRQGLELEAVFSHHRSADELTSEWFWQEENFKRIVEKVKALAKKHDIPPLRFHIDNSASLFRRSRLTYDMVRVGIAAYGCLEMAKGLHTPPLKPVLSLHANKIARKKLQKGSRIGYGGTHTLKNDAIVSTYDVGYGDGLFRSLSNDYETPQKQKLLGRISMDNATFLTQEDTITVFDDAKEVARQLQTIPYEILTSLTPTLQRVVV